MSFKFRLNWIQELFFPLQISLNLLFCGICFLTVGLFCCRISVYGNLMHEEPLKMVCRETCLVVVILKRPPYFHRSLTLQCVYVGFVCVCVVRDSASLL